MSVTVLEKLSIDPEFRDLIPAINKDEYELLKESIITEGCRDALVVWNGVIVDGHNRYEICQKHGIEFKVLNKEFTNREEAMDWIDKNQLARRNLNPDQMSLIRGRRYNRTKKDIGAPKREEVNGKELGQNDPIKTHKFPTAEKLAEEHGVSASTIKRDGKYAEAVEKVKDIDPNINKKISTGNAPPKKAVINAAKILEENPEEAKKVLSGQKTLKKIEKETKKNKLTGRIEKTEDPEKEINEKELFVPEDGSVIKLGRHVLIVGDNMNENIYNEVKKYGGYDLSFADPPYNAGVDDWDKSFVWTQDYLADISRIVCVTPGTISIQKFMKETNMPYKWSLATYITNSMTNGNLGFANWLYTAVFSKEKSIHQNTGDFAEITLKKDGDYSNKYKFRQKPLAYLEWVFDLMKVPRGGRILDVFGGSGATLIVCERTGRQCITVEKDKNLAGIIIARFENETGLKKEVINNVYSL